MRLVALTGGIGSGKSTVASQLGRLGAVVIDADAVVKELQEPGQPVFEAMVERWGDTVVTPDGCLDRAKVAAIVFNDEAEREALGSLVHPAVRAEMLARAGDQADSSGVVILDIPLLAEGGVDRWKVGAVIVVDTPVEVAISRLVQARGFDEADARARVAAQATREERLAIADHVVDNSGTLAHLEVEIDRCNQWLETLDETPWDGA